MTLVDNDPSAENLPSPGLAEQAQPPPYAASPTRSLFNLTWNSVTEMGTDENAAAAALTESEMSEEGETTSVVHHLQRESENHSVNTECDLLVDRAGGMTMSPSRTNCSDEGLLFRMPNLLVNTAGGIMSPPRLNFFSEEAPFLTPNFHANMVGGMMMSTSPPRMNCFSPPSGDSIENSDPFRLWNFADHSEVQVVENRKGMMMPPTWNQPPPLFIDGVEHSFCILQTFVRRIWSLESLILLNSCKPGLSGVTPYLLSLECLCQNMVIELGNGEQIMRLNVKLKHAYLEVDFSSEKSNAICSSQALELESWGGMIMERISVNHQWRYAFCSSKTHPWSVILELLDVVVSLLLYLGTNNYSFGISVNDDRSSSFNTEIHSLLYFERTFLEMQHLNSLERQFLDHFERLVQTGVLELLSGEEIKLRYLQEEVGTASVKNHSVSILPALFEAECSRGGNGMMQLDSPYEGHIPESSTTNEETNVVVGLKRIDAIGNSSRKKDIIWWQKDHGITSKVVQQLFGKSLHDAAKALKVSPSTFKQARRDFGITRRSLEEVGTATEENHTADIWPAPEAQYNAAGTGVMLLQQVDPSSEPHILEFSATNEERNNVVELNNSIDAKGGNSSSHKTDTISRWEKDHGITRQVLEQLFGKSRDAAAKTLKVSTSTLKRACRDFGINRWPNHKGKRPNCSLNQKQDVQAVKKHKGIQPCPALPPLEGTNTSQCNNTMSVKVTYKNDTIRFPLSSSSSSTIKYLEEQLETKLKISLENFSIKYQDEEDEWITLTCDSELMHGMEVLRSCGKTVIRMMITHKFN